MVDEKRPSADALYGHVIWEDPRNLSGNDKRSLVTDGVGILGCHLRQSEDRVGLLGIYHGIFYFPSAASSENVRSTPFPASISQ
jgi:hypothetical protein